MTDKKRLCNRTLCEILLNPDLFNLDLVKCEFPYKFPNNLMDYLFYMINSDDFVLNKDLIIESDKEKINSIKLFDIELNRKHPTCFYWGFDATEPDYLDYRKDTVKSSK